ncbi:hypothetical protein ACT4US_26905, partial [Bacillus sp. HC-Mk]
MYDVVGVRFKKAGKVYYFDPNQFDISENEFVIVETVRGIEYGKVVYLSGLLKANTYYIIQNGHP